MYSDEYGYINSLTYGPTSRFAYDYMPEGYPSKRLKSMIIADEQEVTFSDIGIPNFMGSIKISSTIRVGDKLTVLWDGESYDITVIEKYPYGLAFGNLNLIEETGYQSDLPFAGEINIGDGDFSLFSTDTAESHTIKVILHKVIYTPIDQNFSQPPQNFNVIFTYFKDTDSYTCNVTYSQLRDWFDRKLPIFAICEVNSQGNRYETLIISSYEKRGSGQMYFNCSSSKSGTLNFAYHENGTIGPQNAE